MCIWRFLLPLRHRNDWEPQTSTSSEIDGIGDVEIAYTSPLTAFLAEQHAGGSRYYIECLTTPTTAWSQTTIALLLLAVRAKVQPIGVLGKCDTAALRACRNRPHHLFVLLVLGCVEHLAGGGKGIDAG